MSAPSPAQQARQIQKVYGEWCVKAAEVVLTSRFPEDQASTKPAGVSSTTAHPMQASASFGLRVPEHFGVRSEAIARPEFFQLKTQRSFHLEICLKSLESEAEQLLERWTFTFFPAQAELSALPDRCNQTLVSRLKVAIRALMCFVRLLPACSLQRSQEAAGRLHWRARVEAWPPSPSSHGPSAQELHTQDFVSLQSSVGTLRLSVAHRKDLHAIVGSAACPYKAAPAFGAQMEQIGVEEGYISGAPDAIGSAGLGSVANTGSDKSLGRLDKIAEEEPEARPPGSAPARHAASASGSGAAVSRSPDVCVSNSLGASGPVAAAAGLSEQQSLSTATAFAAAGVESTGFWEPQRGDPRQRLRSEDSVASAASASPRVADRTVVLGSTPPFSSLGSPVALSHQPALQPSRSGSSLHSSRSGTPKSTPKLGPAPDPHSAGVVPRMGPGSGSSSAMLAGISAGSAAGAASGGSSAAASSSVVGGFGSAAAAASAAAVEGRGQGLAISSFGEATLRRSDTPPACGPGQFDDLSDLWMRRPPADWGSRRSISMGTSDAPSRGTCSRSLSPEDTTRATAEDGPSSARRRSKSSLAVADFTGDMSQAEMCLLGMTDDEDDENDACGADSGDDVERNVVASTLQEGRGGGAFVASSRTGTSCIGLALGLDSEADAQFNEGMSSPPARIMSPLIAQLNPFTDMEAFSLPPAAKEGLGAEEMLGEAIPDAATGLTAASPLLGGSFVDPPDERPDVQHLLVEMGDLVCKLQQRRELALASEEASPEELLERLSHFRDVAQMVGVRH